MAKSKRIRGLDCSAPADQMVRLVVRTQLNVMCKLREKALDWKDPEGVHDMRVASRRLRSSLGDFRPYIRRPHLPRLKLRAIAKSLGAVRDEDVVLAALAELEAKAKSPAAEGIKLIAKERRKKRKVARAALNNAISPGAIAELRKEFLTGLRTIAIVLPRKQQLNEAAGSILTFNRLGAYIVNTRLKEFSAASRHLYTPFEISEIHELRILAKRLRYALELFGNCWGDEAYDLARQVAQLQTSLGELHDCDVWIETLGKRLKQTARRNKNDEATAQLRAGANWLLRHFARERMEHYEEALAYWEQWEADKLLERVKALIDRAAPPPDPPRESVSTQGI